MYAIKHKLTVVVNPPCGTPEPVLDYLSRHIYRAAISVSLMR
jgi:hypothetical protein